MRSLTSRYARHEAALASALRRDHAEWLTRLHVSEHCIAMRSSRDTSATLVEWRRAHVARSCRGSPRSISRGRTGPAEAHRWCIGRRSRAAATAVKRDDVPRHESDALEPRGASTRRRAASGQQPDAAGQHALRAGDSRGDDIANATPHATTQLVSWLRDTRASARPLHARALPRASRRDSSVRVVSPVDCARDRRDSRDAAASSRRICALSRTSRPLDGLRVPTLARASPPLGSRPDRRRRVPTAFALSANVDFGMPRSLAAARIVPCCRERLLHRAAQHRLVRREPASASWQRRQRHRAAAAAVGEEVERPELVAAERDRARDRVPQLAHVARPARSARSASHASCVTLLARRARARARRASRRRARRRSPMPLAQRRQREHDRREPVIEVEAQPRATRCRAPRVAVRRRDDAHIDRPLARAADAPHAPRSRARAAGSAAARSAARRSRRGTACRRAPRRSSRRASSVAPVNAPFSWPNSSRRDQLARNRAAVDRDERPVSRAASSRGSTRASRSLPVPVSPTNQHAAVGLRRLATPARSSRRNTGSRPRSSSSARGCVALPARGHRDQRRAPDRQVTSRRAAPRPRSGLPSTNVPLRELRSRTTQRAVRLALEHAVHARDERIMAICTSQLASDPITQRLGPASSVNTSPVAVREDQPPSHHAGHPASSTASCSAIKVMTCLLPDGKRGHPSPIRSVIGRPRYGCVRSSPRVRNAALVPSQARDFRRQTSGPTAGRTLPDRTSRTPRATPESPAADSRRTSKCEPLSRMPLEQCSDGLRC